MAQPSANPATASRVRSKYPFGLQPRRGCRVWHWVVESVTSSLRRSAFAFWLPAVSSRAVAGSLVTTTGARFTGPLTAEQEVAGGIPASRARKRAIVRVSKSGSAWNRLITANSIAPIGPCRGSKVGWLLVRSSCREETGVAIVGFARDVWPALASHWALMASASVTGPGSAFVAFQIFGYRRGHCRHVSTDRPQASAT